MRRSPISGLEKSPKIAIRWRSRLTFQSGTHTPKLVSTQKSVTPKLWKFHRFTQVLGIFPHPFSCPYFHWFANQPIGTQFLFHPTGRDWGHIVPYPCGLNSFNIEVSAMPVSRWSDDYSTFGVSMINFRWPDDQSGARIAKCAAFGVLWLADGLVTIYHRDPERTIGWDRLEFVASTQLSLLSFLQVGKLGT